MTQDAAIPVMLKQLRLSTMAASWEQMSLRAESEKWSCSCYLATLCEEELNERYSRRIARFTKESRLPAGKTLGTFSFAYTPSLKAEEINALTSNTDWVKQAMNVLFFGPSGVGKTHLSSAIGHGLIEKSIRVKQFTATALVQEMLKARQELRLQQFFARLDKYSVIILDDLGYVKKSDSETHVLFEFIAHRYETGSLIITSNQPFGEWDKIFADTSMTVAAIDRVVHHSIIFDIKADSYRKRQAILKNISKKPDSVQSKIVKTPEDRL